MFSRTVHLIRAILSYSSIASQSCDATTNRFIMIMTAPATSMASTASRSLSASLRASTTRIATSTRSITTSSRSSAPRPTHQPLSSQCLRLQRPFSTSRPQRFPVDGGGRTKHRTGVSIALRGTSINHSLTSFSHSHCAQRLFLSVLVSP